MCVIAKRKSFRYSVACIVPIVQRIEQARPKGKMCVQFMLGARKWACITVVV